MMTCINFDDNTRMVDGVPTDGAHQYVIHKHPEIYRQESNDTTTERHRLLKAFRNGAEHMWRYFEERGYIPKDESYEDYPFKK